MLFDSILHINQCKTRNAIKWYDHNLADQIRQSGSTITDELLLLLQTMHKF